MRDCMVRYHYSAKVFLSKSCNSEEGEASSQYQLVSFPREMT